VLEIGSIARDRFRKINQLPILEFIKDQTPFILFEARPFPSFRIEAKLFVLADFLMMIYMLQHPIAQVLRIF